MDPMQILTQFLERNWFFLLIISGLLIALWQQRQRHTFRATPEDFEALIRSGKPVIAEFYSDT